MAIGFTFPLERTSESLGFFKTTSTDIEAVEQNLKSILLTNWGERVMHYYFGCNFKEFLFENNHPDELKSKVAERVSSQVQLWLPFVTIKVLNVLMTEDDSSVPENAFSVRVEFTLTSKPDMKSRSVSVLALAPQ